jgi:hypothetical protein
VVEGTPLLREHRFKRLIEGSNPSLSAKKCSPEQRDGRSVNLPSGHGEAVRKSGTPYFWPKAKSTPLLREHRFKRLIEGSTSEVRGTSRRTPKRVSAEGGPEKHCFEGFVDRRKARRKQSRRSGSDVFPFTPYSRDFQTISPRRPSGQANPKSRLAVVPGVPACCPCRWI